MNYCVEDPISWAVRVEIGQFVRRNLGGEMVHEFKSRSTGKKLALERFPMLGPLPLYRYCSRVTTILLIFSFAPLAS